MTITSDEKYQAMDDAFGNSGIRQLNVDVLTEHLIALSNKPIENSRVQHRDIIRGITVNHLLLQRYLDGVEKRAETTQRYVLALAAVAIILAVAQVWVAFFPPSAGRAEVREPMISSTAVTKTTVPTVASAPIARATPVRATGAAAVK